jgi:hypothetical protein
MSRVVLVTEVPWETDRHSGSFHGKGREFKFESLRVAPHQFFRGGNQAVTRRAGGVTAATPNGKQGAQK